MSRIRSVHPGMFSDPEFVQVSMAARMALIGLWTEADDHGVFEWKPLALKMKVFPGDAVDMEALMAELVSADRIRQVTHEGKPYGICRNFCKYQRPKNPSYRLPFSLVWGDFVGIKLAESYTPPAPIPQPSPSPPENLPQMEDGEKEEEEKKESVGARFEEEFERFWEIYPKKVDRGHALKAFIAARKRGVPLETLIAGAERYRDKPDRDPKYTKNAQGWLTGECWKDSAAEPPPAPPEATPEQKEADRLATLVWAIEHKMPNVINQYQIWDVRKVIEKGLVTKDQCERAGCAA